MNMIKRFLLTITILLAVSAYAFSYDESWLRYPGAFSAGSTVSGEGWKFSFLAIAEPALSLDHTRIRSEVTRTDEPGKPVVFHRFFLDPATKTYFGYDVQLLLVPKRKTATLTFLRLSLPKDQVPADFRLFELKKLPSSKFESGKTIAMDVLKDARTGQRVTDYIKVSFSPTAETTPDSTAPFAARDFGPADAQLHIYYPILKINNEEVPPGIVAEGAVTGTLPYISVSGQGSFILSLCPRPGYSFRKAGVVQGKALSFTWNNIRYEIRSRDRTIVDAYGVWNIYVFALPVIDRKSSLEPEFSYGSVSRMADLLSPM